MTEYAIGTREEWLAARFELLAEEKELLEGRRRRSAPRREASGAWMFICMHSTVLGPASGAEVAAEAV